MIKQKNALHGERFFTETQSIFWEQQELLA